MQKNKYRRTPIITTSSIWQRWWYKIFGPTTLHLQLELALWISLMLLSYSSMLGLYKSSFNKNDGIFLCLVGLVLGRHLLFRWFCTWDPSTHAHSTWTGWLSHILQSHVSGGHVFDRPLGWNQLTLQLQHNQSGSSSSSFFSSSSSSQGNPSFGSVLLGGGSGGGGSGGGSSSRESSGSGGGFPPTGASSAYPSATDRMIQITGHDYWNKNKSTVVSTTMTSTSLWIRLLPSSAVYAYHSLFLRYVWYPWSRMVWWIRHRGPLSLLYRDSRRHTTTARGVGAAAAARKKRSARISGGQPKGRFRHTVQRTLLHLWIAYGPSVQFILAVWVCYYYGQLLYDFRTSSFWGMNDRETERQERNTFLLAVSPGGVAPHELRKAIDKSQYNRSLQPTTGHVLSVLLSFGTVVSIMNFSRLLPPVPDLVAGGNVIRDVRTEARSTHVPVPSSSSSMTGAGFSHSSWIWRKLQEFYWNHLQSPSTRHPASDKTGSASTWPYFERQKSILLENRLQLSFLVVLVRLVENIIVAGILPRSYYVCRYTEHCPPGPPVWQISKLLYSYYDPTASGRSGWRRGSSTGAQPSSASSSSFLGGLTSWLFPESMMESDVLSAERALVGVLVVSVVLLTAQTLILNRSYLNIMSYVVAGEWEPLDDKEVSNPDEPQQQQQQRPKPTVWEARKRYKKGDLVYYPHPTAGGTLYRAKLDSPEGRPYDDFDLRIMNSVLKNEIGHPATSRLLSWLGSLQFLLLLSQTAMGLYFCFFGKDSNAYGLVWAVLAHAVSMQAIVSVVLHGQQSGSVWNSKNHHNNALRRLNAEISAGHF